ncbi:glycosyltransferase family 92 protein RCOM_0530710 [Andrographis paniculata]|uniref:glycosyltransferase family 92 protein RCOM_0530710 n=1 Tax=Andrographis paniculata TaxID=175694 RepID=UPI0021E849E9|nr:glycosyltransferase family 92 protein RCOM_0530710 [Andrographis paniculata]
MDPSDQRRKRYSKRILRQSYSYPPKSLLSVRSLLICFSFFIVLYLLSRTSPLRSYAYRPVLVASSLSLLSSATTRSVKSVHDFGGLFLRLKIENRVLFPDHILLLVRGGLLKWRGSDSEFAFNCVYYSKANEFRNGVVQKKVLSVDEYDGFRSIVRCPVAPANYSNVVSLGKEIRSGISEETAINSWDRLAYAATLDGDSVVVFVKGLNLRPDRESDPRMFSCHFGLRNWGNNPTYMLSTRALTAAQEVVRCSLPRSIQDNPDKAQGIRVTIGATPQGARRGRAYPRLLVPSVARISNPGSTYRPGTRSELCVCTMVWNQAPAIREWIKYHSWLGVEKWFVYDNNSDDGLDEVVRELNAENYNVTRQVWPWIKTQEAGFSHCALQARHQCRWVSFMDVDEYFYFPYSAPGHDQFRASGHASKNALRALVSNISSSSDTVAEIRTSCHSFGPSGLTKPPPRGVTVGYTCRLQSPERHKSIIRPDALDPTLLNVVHHFHLREGFEYVNLPQSAAVINHYKYQVWDVFRAKFHRRVATYVADWQENQNEGSRDRAPGLGTEAIEPPDWSRKFCEVWDTGLSDFVLANMAVGAEGLLPWEM